VTLFFSFGGVDLGNASVRLEGGLQLTAAADGSFATGTLQVDDPTGALTLANLAYFTVTETACSQPRCFTGYAYSISVARGVYRNGAGRLYTIEVADLNVLLHLRAFHAADAKRPEETITARMAWLMASVGMSGLVYDNGYIGAVSSTFLAGERDYRDDGYADDVLADCVVVARVFFVYWDPVALQPSLFFESPNAAINDSTLRISNVLADIDETTTFWSYQSGELEAAGDDIYDGVVYTYPGGRIYRQLASTYTTYGIHRDGRVNTDRARTAARASQQVDQYLSKHSGSTDTITCTVRLPAAKVNLLEAGMRVQAKQSHLPGFTNFTWTRVTRRTLILTEGTNEFYDVQLELSTAGLNSVGGGDPGGLPAPPCSDEHYYANSIYDSVPQFFDDAGTDAGSTAGWIHDTVYNWTVTVTESTVSGTGFGTFTIRDVGSGHVYVNVTVTGTPADTGSFNTGGGFGLSGNLIAALTLVHNDTSVQDLTIDFFVDPSGWVIPDCPPPSSGQWVYNEIPTPAPGGGNRVFYTAFPFADGSLSVFVDNVDETAAVTSYDGVTGSFTLAFDPRSFEVVTDQYQGR
jgi:hypothetical protein